MTTLQPMDRKSRALWQEAAKRKRDWYTMNGKLLRPLGPRPKSVVEDVRFGHRCLLTYARRGDVFDPYWWA